MSYSAAILADSISEAGDRLTTMAVTFPRMVLAEFNTHRVFSRNSASSRAIPVLKQLMRIEENPFVPIYWGKNQSGMQAQAELDEAAREQAVAIWLEARDDALRHTRRLLELEVHKQTANRLLEPFMWHTVIVTATEWSNFFALRNNDMAQPEIHKIAHMMHELYDASEPKLVREGEWHLPLIQPHELRLRKWARNPETVKKVSAARCARVSYLTHDNGRRNYRADLALYERLAGSGHMSPLEHVATPEWCETREISREYYGTGGYHVVTDTAVIREGAKTANFRAWKQLRSFIPNESDFSKVQSEE